MQISIYFYLIHVLVAIVAIVAIDDMCHHRGVCDGEPNAPELHRITTTVGEIQEIILQSQPYKLKTISIEPLAFEISNYLTDDECKEIINVSKQVGLQSSYTQQSRMRTQYTLFDIDQDNFLNLSEMRLTMEQNHDVNLNDADLIEMYETLNIETDDEHTLSKEELMYRHQPHELTQYVEEQLLKMKPSKHSRMSEQTWLFYPDNYNPIITAIHHRLYDLFQLYSIPQYIANDSYTLQVVHYNQNGKYNAHFDSSLKSESGTGDVPCCFIQSKKEKRRNTGCKSCRFMTVLYYLNTVKKGGYTVFPLSNAYYKEKRFNDKEQTFDAMRWRMSRNNLPEVYCDDSADNLKVKSEKGKALIWFNHLFDEESKWMSDVDLYSMHTGCPILQGEKWIANHWILVNDEPLY